MRVPDPQGLGQLRLSRSDMDLNGTCAAGTSLFNIPGNSYWLATTMDTVQGPRLMSGTSRLAVLYRTYEDHAHAQYCLRQLRQ